MSLMPKVIDAFNTPGLRGTSRTAPREIAPGVWWFVNCLIIPIEGNVTHLHNAPYLIVGQEETLLWDTSTPSQWPDLEASLDDVLGDRGLDWVLPSHPETAHCGNLDHVLRKYPDAKVFGDVRDYHLFFPEFADRLVPAEIGAELDLGGHRFVIVDAVIKDLPSTQWGYEASQQVLFVGDGFAYNHEAPLDGDDRPTHQPGECDLISSELAAPPTDEQIVWITKSALYWTRFTRIDQLRDALDDLLHRYPPKLVAPAHGAVIDNFDELLPIMWEAFQLAYDPSLGVAQAGYTSMDA